MISPNANIVIINKMEKKFNYGVSNGWRMLHDTKKIRMDPILDQKDIWTLDSLKNYSKDDTVTHITVL